MAKKDFYVDINLNGNEIQQSTFEKLASAPLNPFEGQNYYDTTLKINRQWNGSQWISGGGGSGGTQIQSDWNQANSSALDFIKNKPTIVSQSALDTEITNRINADASTLASANTHSDSAVSTEAISRTNADIVLQTNINSAISDLRDGVVSQGDTLKKLYNLILGSFQEIPVANINARDAYNAILGMHIFVIDDGDGKWALYKATSSGIGATYIKLSDPDLLNTVLTASQIKVAYESNSDTNGFTNALLSKLNGIAASATANSSDAILLARANHTGTQAATTINEDSTHRFTNDTDKTSATTVISNLATEITNRVNADNALQTNINNAIAGLLDGVATPGNTLQKLYNLILGSFQEITVANIAARDAYTAVSGMHIFVTDDGDTRWALYKATTAGVNATYVKLSDPDLLNAVMSASQIKAAYESNSNTNAFTNALLTKLNAISGTNTGDETTTSIGALIHGATSKTTPVDADEASIWDSVTGLLQKITFANLKAFFATLFLSRANNLSDVADKGTSRYNLDVPALFRVRAVSVANITLSGLQTIDGVVYSATQSHLAAGQTNPVDNGLWVTNTGAWTRPSEFATGLSTQAKFLQVVGGTVYPGTIWGMSNMNAVVIGTDSQTWVNLTKLVGTVAGTVMAGNASANTKLLAKNVTPVFSTNTTSEELIDAIQVPASTLVTGDILEYLMHMVWSGTGAKTYKIYFAPTNLLSDASKVLIATSTSHISSSNAPFTRRFIVISNTSIKTTFPAAAAQDDMNATTGGTNINTTITVPSLSAGFFIIISSTKATGADANGVEFTYIKRNS